MDAKVSFFVQCINKQLITLQNFNIQTCFSQFIWFFSLKFWFKGQIISRIHLILPNAYKLMFFDRNINGNRNVKFLECDYLLVQRCVRLTLSMKMSLGTTNIFSLLLPNVYYSLSYCSLKISDVTGKKIGCSWQDNWCWKLGYENAVEKISR